MRNLLVTPAQRATLSAYPCRLPGVPTEPTAATHNALAMVSALIATHGRVYLGKMWGE